MEKQDEIPYARIERDVRHKYRKNLGLAESTEDVKKFFGYAVKDLLTQAFDNQIAFDYDDIRLAPKSAGGFRLSSKFKGNLVLLENGEPSPLPKIIRRFAIQANRLIQHLEEKRPDKTEIKIHPTPSHAGRFQHPPPNT